MRSPAGRIAIVAGTVVAVVVLFLVFRRSNDDDNSASTTATTSAETTTTIATKPAGPEVIRIAVSGGQVQGPREPSVKKGQRVVLVVSADVSDEVHVHGYDLMKDVSPGAPARIAFAATIPGRFEVELESRKLQILELEVRP